MAQDIGGWLGGLMRKRAAGVWSSLASRAATMPRGDARALRDEARALQRDLRSFLQRTSPRRQAADDHLAKLPLPAGTDWRWRPMLMTMRTWRLGFAAPASGQRLGQDMRIWHDGGAGAPVILRQTQNHAATDLAPFGLLVELLGFSGSYLSLAFDVPAEALARLGRDHILRIELHAGAEQPQPLTIRLNIVNGPNTDVVGASMTVPAGPAGVLTGEFDLSRSAINEARLERMWLDVILEQPRMNALDLRDLILSRHPRTQI